ncbi:hypothetical protein K7432_010280 [Basidiobolus ranarum]|uniref:Uncharacterized protein n=1 Tax=Basidiobolus ranarum TaxID=34480 RepID=A0ABR2WNY7_9FUNG
MWKQQLPTVYLINEKHAAISNWQREILKLLTKYVTIPEFSHGEYSDKDLFLKRPTIKVTGNGSDMDASEPSAPVKLSKPTATLTKPSLNLTIMVIHLTIALVWKPNVPIPASHVKEWIQHTQFIVYLELCAMVVLTK